MDKIRIIKTEQDYQEALKLVEELIDCDPEPDSAEGEQLNLLTTHIQDYEARISPGALPDPKISAYFSALGKKSWEKRKKDLLK